MLLLRVLRAYADEYVPAIAVTDATQTQDTSRRQPATGKSRGLGVGHARAFAEAATHIYQLCLWHQVRVSYTYIYFRCLGVLVNRKD